MKKHKTRRRPLRKTFAEILCAARQPAAESFWRRGEFTSTVRHALHAQGEFRAAHRVGDMKADCVQRAIELTTKPVRIRTHSVNGRRYWSVQFKADKWRALHLPMSVPLRLNFK